MAHSAATSKNSLALLLAMLGLLGGGLFGLKEHFRNRASRVDLQKEADMLRGELEAKDVALLRLQRDLRQLQENTGVYPSHAAKNDGASAAELATGQSNVSPRIGNSAATDNPVQNGLGEAAPDDPEPMRLKILEGIGILGDQLANRSVDLAILQLDLAAKADELGIPCKFVRWIPPSRRPIRSIRGMRRISCCATKSPKPPGSSPLCASGSNRRGSISAWRRATDKWRVTGMVQSRRFRESGGSSARSLRV